jgi:hypothetical protein
MPEIPNTKSQIPNGLGRPKSKTVRDFGYLVIGILNLFTRQCRNGHACVPKRHFGVQAWANRSSRLQTVVDSTF